MRTSEDKEAIRDFVLSSMKISKKKHEHYGRAIDYALNLLDSGVDPRRMISGESAPAQEVIEISASPFNSEMDHRHHMARL